MAKPVPLREGLPPLPARLAHLPIDERGYPVPRFVARVNGKPDHRVADAAYLVIALRDCLCWVCGNVLAPRERVFLIGPASVINRTTPEPPMHEDCAHYAASVCPFLMRPAARRRIADLPEDASPPPGVTLPEHPRVICIWHTSEFGLERHPLANGGLGFLFALGKPSALEFLCGGRPAYEVEVFEALHESATALERIAAEDGDDLGELYAMVHTAMALVQTARAAE